jgi:hypothetical protein
VWRGCPKTNKQIKITLDTTETFDEPDSVQTWPFFTAGPRGENTLCFNDATQSELLFVSLDSLGTPFHLTLLHAVSLRTRGASPQATWAGSTAASSPRVPTQLKSQFVQYAKSQLGFCSLLSRTPCVVPARIIGREMAIERAHTRWSLATNGRIGERSVMLPAALKVHAYEH